jgi:hypothetical protein
MRTRSNLPRPLARATIECCERTRIERRMALIAVRFFIVSSNVIDCKRLRSDAMGRSSMATPVRIETVVGEDGAIEIRAPGTLATAAAPHDSADSSARLPLTSVAQECSGARQR